MSADVTRLRNPAPQVAPRAGPKDIDPVERIALFVCALKREGALELLEGFADEQKRRARSFARTVSTWDSSTRQGRLTREFGPRDDAVARVHELVLQAPPGLRRAIVEQLPLELRTSFPHLQKNGEASPVMRALAARLVREAMRR